MWYIKSMPENGNYGNPHYPAREGDIELPDILVSDFTADKGFVNITVENGVVSAVEKNVEAYNKYMAKHPDTPPPPTDLERIEAQALYTALMTDTLLEE